MENFKLSLAYAITLFIMVLGSICAFNYLQTPGDSNVFVEIVYMIGTAIVFYPAFEFWLDICKKMLGLKKK